PEARLAGEGGREIQRASAEIEVQAVRSRFPPEPPHRGPAPATIQVEAQEMVEEVVARRDGGEHAPHVGALRVAPPFAPPTPSPPFPPPARRPPAPASRGHRLARESEGPDRRPH